MANFKSALFFVALLGLGAFGSSYATPYIPRQGSDHIQTLEPSNQQEDDFRLAAPLQQLPAAPSPSSQLPASPAPPSTELQQSPPRADLDVEPMDQQEGGSTEVIVQSLTEDERGNLVSYLICEMCRELQVSMCIRMCDGEEGNGTQIEAAGGNATQQQTGEEDASIVAVLGDSEVEAGNSTSADNSTLSAAGEEEAAAGNGTQSTAQEDDSSLFNISGAEEEQESGNATSSAAEAGGNSTQSEASSGDIGQSGNSTSSLTGEAPAAAGNGTESNAAAQGSEEEGSSIFNVLGDGEEAQSGNATAISDGNENGNSTLSTQGQAGGNGTEAAATTGDEESEPN